MTSNDVIRRRDKQSDASGDSGPVRAKLAAMARAWHQSLDAYLRDVLTREADTPTMSEVLADIEAIKRATGLTGTMCSPRLRAAAQEQVAVAFGVIPVMVWRWSGRWSGADGQGWSRPAESHGGRRS